MIYKAWELNLYCKTLHLTGQNEDGDLTWEGCTDCHDTGMVEDIGGELVDVVGYKKCKCGLLDD